MISCLKMVEWCIEGLMKKINRDDVDKFHDYGIYIPRRTIYMGSVDVSVEHGESGTDSSMVEFFIKNLMILEGMSDDPITIIMNNIGGDVNHGLAIYDAIKNSHHDITIKAFGSAMSMGSIILQAADHRIMSPNASQMLHYGTWAFDGHAKTGQKIAKENERQDQWMEQMYLEKILEKHPDYTIAKLKKILDHDTFLNAREAVDLGLADKILGEDEHE